MTEEYNIIMILLRIPSRHLYASSTRWRVGLAMGIGITIIICSSVLRRQRKIEHDNITFCTSFQGQMFSFSRVKRTSH